MATTLTTTDQPYGIEHTVECTCGYRRHWASKWDGENDHITHECWD